MSVQTYTATEKLLIASKIKGIGRKTLLSLANDSLFVRLDPSDWSDYAPEFSNFLRTSPTYSLAIKNAELDIEKAVKLGHKIISPCDTSYPKLLINNSDQPPLLFVKGNLNNLHQKSIAIIGTREPSAHGIIVCDRITKFFADRQWLIVSGLALGLDTIAHKSTLESNGITAAVLAHGLDTISPKQNSKLADDIVESGGLLLSEYAYNTPIFPSNFVERDKIQAALSKAVVMIQSDIKGGSLHASRAILNYGRKLIVPYPTNQDINNKYPKIEANLKIANENDASVSSFLKCSDNDLKNLIILKSKNEYLHLEQNLLEMDV